MGFGQGGGFQEEGEEGFGYGYGTDDVNIKNFSVRIPSVLTSSPDPGIINQYINPAIFLLYKF